MAKTESSTQWARAFRAYRAEQGEKLPDEWFAIEGNKDIVWRWWVSEAASRAAEAARLAADAARKRAKYVPVVAQPVTRSCERCGDEFTPARRSDARYCSVRCRVAAHRAAAIF